MNAAKDERKTLTPSFRMLIPQATSKKVENYLDARTGKSDVPLNCVICPPNVDPADAPDKYTRALWATSLETQALKLMSQPGSKGLTMAMHHAATANAKHEALF
jgi:hypothetical protein